MQRMSQGQTILSQNFRDFLRSLEAQSIPAWEHTEKSTIINCEFFGKRDARMCYITVSTAIPGTIDAGFFIMGKAESIEKRYTEGSERALVSEIANFIKQHTDIDVNSSAFENGYNPLEWTLRSIKSTVEAALQNLSRR